MQRALAETGRRLSAFVGRIDQPKRSSFNPSSETGKVVAALENPNFQWRTIKGIATETGIDFERVHEIIFSPELKGVVVNSGSRSKEGYPIYSTREHYERTRGALNKILDAAAGRIR